MTAELHLLGGAALIGADGQLVSGAAVQPRRLAVLAVLAEAWPAPVTRDRLVGLLWPDQDEPGARRLLTQALYALRRELGDIVRGAGRDLVLDADVLPVDLIAFRRAIADGDMQRAAVLYRGPLLDGVHVRGAVEFERWTDTVREATSRQFRAAVERVAAEAAAAGEWRDVARWIGRLVPEAPYDSALAIRLVDCWLAVGDRGAALAEANAFERRVRTGLEIEPDPAVRARIREALREAHDRGAEDGSPDPALLAPPRRTGALSPAAVSPAAVSPDAVPPAAIPPDAPSPEPRSRGARYRRRAGMLLPPLAAVAAVGAMLLARSTPGESSTRAIEVPQVTIRGDSALALQASAATRVLVANLDGAGGTRVREPQAHAPLPDRWATLVGEVAALGGRIRFDARLVSGTDGRTLRTASATGAPDSLLALAERISLALLPALYPPELERRLDAAALAAFTRADAAKQFLDGEVALRRGAVDVAHERFRTATELDSTAFYGWYRRAVAAEMAHRMDDADTSVARARTRVAAVPPRWQELQAALARWRGGDALGADSILRALLRADAHDRDAWFELAEVGYHGGPLHGRPLDEARDAWDRVIALDSGDVPALMHGIRLAARAGDHRAVRALLARATSAGAQGAALAESRVIAVQASGDARAVRHVGRMLDSLPEYSFQFLQGVVAGQLEQPEAAVPIARRMTAASRPSALQGEGYLALAHLALARGRWREAMQALDSATAHDPIASAWSRAYFATLPFVQLSAAGQTVAMRQLAAAPTLGGAAPLYLQTGAAESAGAVIQPYLGALLRLAAADGAAASSLDAGSRLPCTAFAPVAMQTALCADLQLALDAEVLRRAGRMDEALAHLERMTLQVPYQLAGRSPLYARSRERFVRAMLLEATGRDDEAERWYAASVHGAWADYIFLAPSHLGRARIRERRGDRRGAAEHYRKVLELLPAPDAELAAIRRAADVGLARVSASTVARLRPAAEGR